MDGLYHDPFGYPHIENDFVRIRYAITKQIMDIKPLCVHFSIDDNNDVELLYVEEHLAYCTIRAFRPHRP